MQIRYASEATSISGILNCLYLHKYDIFRNSKDVTSISSGYRFIHQNLIFHQSVPFRFADNYNYVKSVVSGTFLKAFFSENVIAKYLCQKLRIFFPFKPKSDEIFDVRVPPVPTCDGKSKFHITSRIKTGIFECHAQNLSPLLLKTFPFFLQENVVHFETSTKTFMYRKCNQCTVAEKETMAGLVQK